MQVGLCTIALRGMDIYGAIEIARSNQVDALEIWGRAPHLSAGEDEQSLIRLREAVYEAGLRVSVLDSYLNPATPGFADEYPGVLQSAQVLEAPTVRVWAGSKGTEQVDEELWWQCADALKGLCQAAEDLGIMIAIEVHAGTLADSCEGTLHLLELTAQDNLRLNWQPYTHAECEDSLEVLRRLAPYVANIHAQNFRQVDSANPPQYELCLIEDGFVDYAEVVQIMRSVDYSGCLAVEFLQHEFETSSAMLTCLRKDIDYLRRLVYQGD